MVNDKEAQDFAVLAYDHKAPAPKGWVRDKALTDADSQVFHHPERKETHISYRGTSSLGNAKTAAAMYLGLEDSRVKHESNKFKKAHKKYGKVSLSGHSLGGTLADKIGEKHESKVKSLHTFGALETPDMHSKDRKCGKPENRNLKECKAQSKRTRTRTKFDPVSYYYHGGANKNVTEKHSGVSQHGVLPFHSTSVYSQKMQQKKKIVKSPGNYVAKRRRYHGRYSNKR